MAKKAGRKNKYDTYIKPNLDKIKKLASTCTEKDIAKQLGVSLSSFMEYKNKHVELANVIKEGRQSLIVDLKSALVKKALGFFETDTIKTEGFNKNGDIVSTTQTHKKYYAPDTGAAHLLLKNYDRDNWAEDWHKREIQDEELKLKVRAMEIQEKNVWE